MLGDDPFQVPTADFSEEVPAAAANVICEEHHGRVPGNDRAKHLFSFDERDLPHVTVVHGENVKRDEGEGAAPLHQVAEDRPAALVELHDLAVEHAVVGVRFERDLGTEIIEPAGSPSPS